MDLLVVALQTFNMIPQRIKDLVARCIDHIELSDIKLLLLDHDFIITDLDLVNLITTIKQEREQYRVSLVNSRLLSHRASMLLNAAKARATEKNLEFNITKEWVLDKLTKGKCEATGLDIVLTGYLDSQVSNPYAPSIDRRDNSKGYTVDNSQLVLVAYNKFKSDYDEQEVLTIAKALVEKSKHTVAILKDESVL